MKILRLKKRRRSDTSMVSCSSCRSTEQIFSTLLRKLEREQRHLDQRPRKRWKEQFDISMEPGTERIGYQEKVILEKFDQIQTLTTHRAYWHGDRQVADTSLLEAVWSAALRETRKCKAWAVESPNTTQEHRRLLKPCWHNYLARGSLLWWEHDKTELSKKCFNKISTPSLLKRA